MIEETNVTEPEATEPEGKSWSGEPDAKDLDEKLDEAGEAEALAYLEGSHGYRLIDVLAEYADSHVVRHVCRELRAELRAPFEAQEGDVS